MNKSKEPLVGWEKKCPVCGKTFWAGSQWAYKRGYERNGYLYICSWKCLNKWDERKENGSHKKKRIERDAAGEGNGTEVVFSGF